MRWFNVSVMVCLLGLTFGSAVWAKGFKSQGTGLNVGSAPGQANPNYIDQDRAWVRQDLIRIRQHKRDFQKQLKALKSQRVEALRSKNKDQAKVLAQQIEQLQQQYRAQCWSDRLQLGDDRRLLHMAGGF